MLNKNIVDFNENISPIAFAHEMLKNTSDDGTLYMDNWYDVDCEDCSTYNNFMVNINWSANDLKSIFAEFNALVNDIEFIANILNDYNATLESLPEILVDNSLVATYFIYLAPFDAANQQELHADIIGRLSEGLCGYEIIRHSQRLCRLFSLNAPQTVIENEERMLIASIILHWYGERIEKAG